ncbi:hydroxymethylpyrimidine/phosphomethylpyrimidine kinase [Tindallia magadiensis]|uniref:Hydroxymethylpyrimidine/phosphomethylpyrimidine kinase n=1 Tax=Tindallia magadiensis TaxID=69895 RepID=A0A1I3CT90_9FIRM|nr:bifunctional hydroxymethylpyrimidine kinase/phosphomethylpyrimidine kinase [Tindallia magadiensis]SFH77556.1 hydroxymethylpyrimidine/phosphomethylpyrimidine kinase [Tindallia magadiensis]
MKNLVTIAGSDSSGGAGIQADLKTFCAHGVFGMSVITAVTAQNTQGVTGVQDIEATMINKQLEALWEDCQIHGIKIGMVSTIDTITTIASFLRRVRKIPVVLDPVMVSKSGFHLLKPESKKAMLDQLLPLATVVTPNLPEAEVITGLQVSSEAEMKKAGEAIHRLGPSYVLMKGGHLPGEEAVDLLYDGENWYRYACQRIDTKNTHGTGCTLSASLAANLAKEMTMREAVEASKTYMKKAIEESFAIGSGPGPVHHFHEYYDLKGRRR